MSQQPQAKEKYADSGFSFFPAHAKNGPRWVQMGSGGFFPTNPDLADILGRTDFDFENFYLWDFLGPKILAWAHPLGPHVGPPTWAHVAGLSQRENTLRKGKGILSGPDSQLNVPDSELSSQEPNMGQIRAGK